MCARASRLVAKAVSWLFVAVIVFSSGTAHAGDMSFEDRVQAQRAIEEVYWRHRIWPKENPQPKPPLAEVLPDAAIRARVEGYVKKSNALDAWWRRPITGEQLQAEMDRMARQSRDPEMLRELFAALGNDPLVIAETLARQTLADRLIRSWYSTDKRFHGALRAQAEAALAASGGRAAGIHDPRAERRDVRWVLRKDDDAATAGAGDLVRAGGGPDEISSSIVSDGPARVEVNEEEWCRLLGRLAGRRATDVRPGPVEPIELSGSARAAADLLAEPARALADPVRASADLLAAVPTGVLGRLVEESDRFEAVQIVSKRESELTAAVVTWAKVTFEDWWGESRGRLRVDLDPPSADYILRAIEGTACSTPESWKDTYLGAPAARFVHTAVWTGTEMIVWGGYDGSSLNTGGRYNASTDSWTATSTAGAPAARWGHTGVWTGTEMIVWGGTRNSIVLSTGGRYDPSIDSWTATSTAGAAAARYDHTAVWTGTEMIVWGGTGASSAFSTGGRYDPSTNSWTATSVTGAPAARYVHTAVWTGTEMIVWGGTNASSIVFNTGGRYNPSTDSWTDDRLPTKSSLAWDAVPGAVPGTTYDVVQGRVNELPPGIGPSETCRTPPGGVAQTSIVAPDLPPIGWALWYLVRARNSCGRGSYGSWSNGAARFTDACP